MSQMLIADPLDLGGAQAKTQRYVRLGYNVPLGGGDVIRVPPSVNETDIGFDPNLMAGSNDAFKVSIIRHEIGHLLGLQHVEKSNSLMFATILSGSATPIDQGSLDGITFLYGEPEDLRNLTVAYLDTLGSGIRVTDEFGVVIHAENAVFEMAYSPGGESVYARAELGAWKSADGGACDFSSWPLCVVAVGPCQTRLPNLVH
jgi:hypothetical protein